MPLVSMSELLAAARQGNYAVCYCEAWNLESLQATMEAAEETESPIITGFNGGFLAHPERRSPEDVQYYGALAQALRNAKVPVSLLLNETADMAQIEKGMEAGFTAVMVENEGMPLDSYRTLVQEVVAKAHRRRIPVEAQVGHLPGGFEGADPEGELTDPEMARAFVAETGVDALGVSIGNIHILTRGKASVNLALLEKIHHAVDLPLVIHGGTGIPNDCAADVIRLGVAKVNIGTMFKQAYLEAVRGRLRAYRDGANPHPFLGMGGPCDITVAGRTAVRNKVKEVLELYRSIGKARRFVLAGASQN